MIEKGDFERVMEEAGAVLASLIYPRSAEKLSVREENLYRRALCYEGEYLYGGRRGQGTVRSEKIGNYAVEYHSPSEKRAVSVNGWEVSPAAVGLLYEAGLMLRWV